MLAERRSQNSFHCKTTDCRGWCIYEDSVNEFRCPICRALNCLLCKVTPPQCYATHPRRRSPGLGEGVSGAERCRLRNPPRPSTKGRTAASTRTTCGSRRRTTRPPGKPPTCCRWGSRRGVGCVRGGLEGVPTSLTATSVPVPPPSQTLVQIGEAMHCPTCLIIVQKKDGCDWIRCTVCQTEICWVTKGPRWGPGVSRGGAGGGLEGPSSPREGRAGPGNPAVGSHLHPLPSPPSRVPVTPVADVAATSTGSGATPAARTATEPPTGTRRRQPERELRPSHRGTARPRAEPAPRPVRGPETTAVAEREPHPAAGEGEDGHGFGGLRGAPAAGSSTASGAGASQ